MNEKTISTRGRIWFEPLAGKEAKHVPRVPSVLVADTTLQKERVRFLAIVPDPDSKSPEREVSVGRIIHGDDHASLKVKTSAVTSEVRKRIENIGALLANPWPPDLVLNRHCAECEFQAR
jgi:hypothetical protein